jgi:hypothetical protein
METPKFRKNDWVYAAIALKFFLNLGNYHFLLPYLNAFHNSFIYHLNII